MAACPTSASAASSTRSARSRSSSPSAPSSSGSSSTRGGRARSTGPSSRRRSRASTRSRTARPPSSSPSACCSAGVAIFLYLAGAVVELIAEGVLGDRFGERRRRRTIEQLRDHTIICGYGRVGRRIARGVRRARNARTSILDVTPESVELARAEGRLVVHGDGTRDDDLERAGARARQCARRLSRLRREQPLHHPVGACRAAGPVHRRPGLGRIGGAQARAGGRESDRRAVLARGPADRQPRAQAAGRRLPRHRVHARRSESCASRRSRSTPRARRPAGRSGSCACATRPGR